MIKVQPTLVGRLLKIRPLLLSDFECLYKVAADPKIWELHHDPLRYQRKHFTEKYFDKVLQSGGGLVFERGEGELIGASSYYNYRAAYADVMIGYTFLSRDCWGEGYNREIKSLMMNHIYEWVERIYFTVGVNNERSKRAMGKIGGRLVSEEERERREIGEKGLLVFEIRKRDYKGLLE